MGIELYEETQEKIDARNLNIHMLYHMEFHEEKIFNGWNVTRVPGGWIYSHGNGHCSVFIPFNNEFQKCSDNQ